MRRQSVFALDCGMLVLDSVRWPTGVRASRQFVLYLAFVLLLLIGAILPRAFLWALLFYRLVICSLAGVAYLAQENKLPTDSYSFHSIVDTFTAMGRFLARSCTLRVR